MRLPSLLLESQFFLFSSFDELSAALGDSVDSDEIDEVARLSFLGLPPISSRDVLATMLGINPGLIWSFEYRPAKHYRVFSIPKGRRKERVIVAPRIAIKVVQKWLSVQLQRRYAPPMHVFGFIPGRSHINAAQQHRLARWTYSVDIKNFFSSTPIDTVTEAFLTVGYGHQASEMLARLCCYHGFLAQGAPSSPILSNLAFQEVDNRLITISEKFDIRMSRYADDIVFSGTHGIPDGLPEQVNDLFVGTPWTLSPEKTEFNELPRRLKVHGLLVHGDQVRLTKGYRNKLRAYAHLMKNGQIREDDSQRVSGHLRYAQQVANAED
jgi:hypothetical protein